MQNFKIAPSILSANFAKLGQEVEDVLAAGADMIHFDVMDNHFVPNLTIGALVCNSLRKHGIKEPIDVHLMVENPDSLIVDFAKARATSISIHTEAAIHLDRSLSLISSQNCKAGVVLNPATPLEVLDYVIDSIDYVLIMSVNPGFGGQSFIKTSLKKIEKLREKLGSRKVNIAVDGGIKLENIRQVASAGADTFILGSGIFQFANSQDANTYDTIIAKLRDELAKL